MLSDARSLSTDSRQDNDVAQNSTSFGRDSNSLSKENDGASQIAATGTVDVVKDLAIANEWRLLQNIGNRLGNGVSLSEVNNSGSLLVCVNAVFEQMTGYTREECTGRHLSFFERETDNEQIRVAEMFATVVAGSDVRATLKHYRKNNEPFWIDLLLSPMMDSSGDVTHILGIHKDISDQVRARVRSEIEFNQAKLILDSVGEGIYGVDANGTTTFFNAAAEAITGWTAEEMIGRSAHSLIHHSHPDGTPFPVQDCPIYKAIRDGFVHRSDKEVFWRKDGTSIPVEYTSAPLMPNEAPAGVVVLFQDISDRKRREFAESQANQAKTDFLSNMSHEIRTPMNGVLGTVQLLLSTELTNEQRRYAEIAQSSGSMLLALIDSILDLSKIEAGKTVIEKLNFDLTRTLDDVVGLWRIQCDLKGLEFTLRVEDAVPLGLCGDPGRLRQVLNNLISNAIKFTEQGGVTLHVDVASLERGSVTLRFSLCDTGIGMRPDQTKGLFQPFVQADSSTTRKYGGTGLGLAICKRLVELMNGEIGVISEEGKGSEFWFTVVLGVGSERPPQRQSVTEELIQRHLPADQATLVRPRKRILLAEDNATNQLVALAQLEKLGYNADAVRNGVEAVEAARTGTYDVILMDCEMPVMDGYEATRRIRKLPVQKIPIIALTAHAMTGHREACLAAGMDFHLSKPLDMQRLARTLQTWCRDSQFSGHEKACAPHERTEHPQTADFDAGSLLKRLMDDEQIAKVIIHGFLEDCPLQLEELRRRIAETDGPGVRLQAHALKGSAAAVSAVKLSGIAHEMEKGSEQMEYCSRLLPEATQAFADFKIALSNTKWL